MGLSASLSNALSGMNTTQRGLEVLSRNVSNVGTPGYHKQSLVLVDKLGANSSFARFSGVERAFNEALQRSHTTEVSGKSYADLRSSFLQRLETALGKPGDANSLDTIYQDFETSLRELATSPDDYATRAMVLSYAQTLVGSLNELSAEVQGLRQEAENQMASQVSDLNQMLEALAGINDKLSNDGVEQASRAALLDERDRLVQGVAEIVDVQVVYRTDDTVSLMSKSGLGLLDRAATKFEFTPVGKLSADTLYDIDDSLSGVGRLTAITPSGLTLDVFDQGLVGSGSLAALVDMRDTTLVQMQSQLDEIAAGLATALSTVETDGTAAVVGAQNGFDIDADPTQILAGNELTINYRQGGVEQTLRVVRVDDTSKLPMEYINTAGERVLGVDFSAGLGAVATALDAALGPSISVTNPAGTTLQFLDDGAANTSDILGVSSRHTATGVQGDGSAMSFFVDGTATAFTNSLDGTPQKRGFAARIAINSQILADNTLLVKETAGTSLGDDTRPNFLVERLETQQFRTDSRQAPGLGSYSFSGSIEGLVSQVLDYQGSQIESAKSTASTKGVALEAVEQRMAADYGVNIDEEMTRLMELQNAYAASARVVSIVQDLLDTLIQI